MPVSRKDGFGTAGVYEVAIVGAGPVGLTLAIALAQFGVSVVLLDEGNLKKEGSRAICFSKRSLEIFGRLGVAEPMLQKGVEWNVGRIYYRDKEIDCFTLSPEKYSKYPAFINLQQYYVEKFLEDAAGKEKNIEIRRMHKVFGLEAAALENGQPGGHVKLKVLSPESEYGLEAKFVIACDGSKSTIRHLMGLDMQGERFEERFLITDFIMEEGFPPERRFWFDPPFAPGQSVLMHKQPDNCWRLDFKLGKSADNALANDHAFIREKIKNVVGDRPFEIAWASIYSFSNKMLEKFVYGQVIFAGDAAHVLSPFGARGANSGIEDADNLAWKLAQVIKSGAPASLLQTYDRERAAAARQNIRFTNHSAAFIAPPSAGGLNIRNQILEKAATNTLAKKQINCGRLSTPAVYGKIHGSENGNWQNTALQPGHAVKDCFFNNGHDYLIDHLDNRFTIICLRGSLIKKNKDALAARDIKMVEIDGETSPVFLDLYELRQFAAYLVTPDLYVLGKWKNFTTQDAVTLIGRYFSGEGFSAGDVPQSEQGLIDEDVFRRIKG